MPDQPTIVAAIVTSPRACSWPDVVTANRSEPFPVAPKKRASSTPTPPCEKHSKKPVSILSPAIRSGEELTSRPGATLLSSTLLETDLRRLAVRADLAQAAVTHLLAHVDLVETDRSLHREAGLLPGRHLRSLDALHLAAALRVGADVMVTYDHRQADAAAAAGLPVLTPWPMEGTRRRRLTPTIDR